MDLYLVCKRVETTTPGSDPCVVLHATASEDEAQDLREGWGIEAEEDGRDDAVYFVQIFTLTGVSADASCHCGSYDTCPYGCSPGEAS